MLRGFYTGNSKFIFDHCSYVSKYVIIVTSTRVLMIFLSKYPPHLLKRTYDLKQNGIQEKATFSGIVFVPMYLVWSVLFQVPKVPEIWSFKNCYQKFQVLHFSMQPYFCNNISSERQWHVTHYITGHICPSDRFKCRNWKKGNFGEKIPEIFWEKLIK